MKYKNITPYQILVPLRDKLIEINSGEEMDIPVGITFEGLQIVEPEKAPMKTDIVAPKVTKKKNHARET
jgi:hypothetical protein